MDKHHTALYVMTRVVVENLTSTISSIKQTCLEAFASFLYVFDEVLHDQVEADGNGSRLRDDSIPCNAASTPGVPRKLELCPCHAALLPRSALATTFTFQLPPPSPFSKTGSHHRLPVQVALAVAM